MFTRKNTAFLLIVTMLIISVFTLVPAKRVHAESQGQISAGVTDVRCRATPGGDIMKDTSGSTIYLNGGQALTIIDKSNSAWYKVSFSYRGANYTGYVSSQFITETNSAPATAPASTPSSDGDFEASLSNQGFPESYKPYLRELHAKYPNWVFKSVQTGINWNTLVDNEINKQGQVKNLIQCYGSNYHYNWRSTSVGYDYKNDRWSPYDGYDWYAASDGIVAYYLDPRTYLYEDYIFLFESLSYQQGLQNEQGVEAILAGSFMSYAKPSGSSQTYAQIIMTAAAQSGVSPYHIASRIRQEMGSSGSSACTGRNSTYPGYYNFFNIGAYDSPGGGAIENGLAWAKSGSSYGRPWNTPEKAIIGGSQWLGASYINVGQDTLYTQKFNVTNTGNLFWHQYMTNVQAPSRECLGNYEAYAANNLLKSTMVFKIPVYTNMPNSAVAKPADSGNPNNWLKSLSVNGYGLTPSFSVSMTTDYSLILPESTASITVNAAPVNGNARVAGTGTINLAKGTNIINIVVTAQSGNTRTYHLTVVRGNASAGTNIIGGDGGSGSTPGGKGDLNGDGRINTVDIVKVQRIIVGLDGSNSAADINGDGKVNTVDIVKIQRHIVGIESIQ